jgi:hypothetical protein
MPHPSMPIGDAWSGGVREGRENIARENRIQRIQKRYIEK